MASPRRGPEFRPRSSCVYASTCWGDRAGTIPAMAQPGSDRAPHRGRALRTMTGALGRAARRRPLSSRIGNSPRRRRRARLRRQARGQVARPAKAVILLLAGARPSAEEFRALIFVRGDEPRRGVGVLRRVYHRPQWIFSAPRTSCRRTCGRGAWPTSSTSITVERACPRDDLSRLRHADAARVGQSERPFPACISLDWWKRHLPEHADRRAAGGQGHRPHVDAPGRPAPDQTFSAKNVTMPAESRRAPEDREFASVCRARGGWRARLWPRSRCRSTRRTPEGDALPRRFHIPGAARAHRRARPRADGEVATFLQAVASYRRRRRRFLLPMLVLTGFAAVASA